MRGKKREVRNKKITKKQKNDPLWREIDFIWFYFGLFLKRVLKGTVRTDSPRNPNEHLEDEQE